jgi:uncharacterized membrane protein YbaN (DUF454 family)
MGAPFEPIELHPSRAVRVALVAAGTAFVALGIAGIVVPVLPTTPFLLLAAACYARASTRFYGALVRSRLFGPMILEWRRHRSVPKRTKAVAIALMAATLGVSIVFAVEHPYARIGLAALGFVLAFWIASLPSRA